MTRPPADQAVRDRMVRDFDTTFLLEAGAGTGTGKTTVLVVTVRGRVLVGVSLSVQHLSGKKLVAQAYGNAIPMGGGNRGKDPRKVDPRGQATSRPAGSRCGAGRRHDRLHDGSRSVVSHDTIVGCHGSSGNW